MVEIRPFDVVAQYPTDHVVYQLRNMTGKPQVRGLLPPDREELLKVDSDGDVVTVSGGIPGAHYELDFGGFKVRLIVTYLVPKLSFCKREPAEMTAGKVIRYRNEDYEIFELEV